jgi:hypothetical protein
VRRNLSSVLILENDANWDIRIRDQFTDLARASHVLTRPLLGSTGVYADPTYPSPPEGYDSPVSEIPFEHALETRPPTVSPYGDQWDILWAGQRGMRFPGSDNIIPKGRVIWTDQTVPQQQYLWTITAPDELKEQDPNHTRVVHHVQEAACSLGYAVTQKSARKLITRLA